MAILPISTFKVKMGDKLLIQRHFDKDKWFMGPSDGQDCEDTIHLKEKGHKCYIFRRLIPDFFPVFVEKMPPSFPSAASEQLPYPTNGTPNLSHLLVIQLH